MATDSTTSGRRPSPVRRLRRAVARRRNDRALDRINRHLRFGNLTPYVATGTREVRNADGQLCMTGTVHYVQLEWDDDQLTDDERTAAQARRPQQRLPGTAPGWDALAG